MDNKTRVWHGGLAEIMRANAPAPNAARAGEAESGASSENGAQRPDGAHPQAKPGEPPLAGTHRKTLVGHAFDLSMLQQGQSKHANLSATRVVPIESLLGSSRAPSGASASAESKLARAPKCGGDEDERAWMAAVGLRLNTTHLRRASMAVLGVFVVALWSWGQLRGQASAPPLPRAANARESPSRPQPKAVRAAANEAPRASGRVTRASERAAQSSPTAAKAPCPPARPGARNGDCLPAQVASSPAAPLAQPRKAVDALASGDFVAAQRIYAELAKADEASSVYSEAARILEQRLKTTTF